MSQVLRDNFEYKDSYQDMEYINFLESNPEYTDTLFLDDVRDNEFSRLDKEGLTYLDYTGAALYSEKLVLKHVEELKKAILGNPHSFNAPSQLSSLHIDSLRDYIRSYIGDLNCEYEVIFTANASSAVKLVSEAFPFTKESTLLMTEDNHNSIHGIRTFAQTVNSKVIYSPVSYPELRIKEKELNSYLSDVSASASLFAMPAQSNVSGVKHDLSWIKKAKSLGWFTLLDAAAYMPSNRINVKETPADYICISFYKMFGYPTGLGCLLVKRDAMEILNRPSFSGGSVSNVGVNRQFHIASEGAEAFEDGTPNFSVMAAVEDGLKWLNQIGVENISARTSALTDYVIRNLDLLAHSNGKKLVSIYGPKSKNMRGATISFHLRDPEGSCWPTDLIEELAFDKKISLRAGFHCNPGCIERIHQLDESQLNYIYDSKNSNEEILIRQQELMTGVFRVSFGAASTFSDAKRFLEFLSQFVNVNEYEYEDIA